MRIVSLLSSATEVLYALGLDDRLVGISHECDYPLPALSRPRVSRSRFDPSGLDSGEIDRAVRAAMAEHGSVYEVDAAMLEELRPDLVLTQAICEVCAVPVGSVEDAVLGLEHRPRVLSLDAHTLDGILGNVREVGAAAGEPGRGEEVAGQLRSRLDRVGQIVGDRPRPRTLLLEWLDPPFAPGHWVPGMVEAAGGENMLGEAGLRSSQLAWSDLSGLDPDVLLIEPCGYDLAGARADADRNDARLREIAGRAIEGRVWLLHSSYFSRSGPRVVDGVEALAAALHPDAFPDAATAGIVERWR